MKFSNLSFPHPVLGINDEVRGACSLYPAPIITSNADTYSIVINCNHDNADLINLVNAGLAEYACEATCSNTLYRTTHTSSSSQISFEIPKKQVKGKVNFLCVLVAKTPIKSYTNTESHSDYAGFTFDIETGDTLAFFDEFHFNASINYEKLNAVSSFMEVVENSDVSAMYTNIYLDKSKIEVQLPARDYQIFASESISKDPKLASVFHSSIVMNALLTALYNFEKYKDQRWAEAIAIRLKGETQFETLSIDEPENIPEIAQRLMGNPFHRLISGLQLITKSPNENDDN